MQLVSSGWHTTVFELTICDFCFIHTLMIHIFLGTGLFTRIFASQDKYGRVLGCDYSESMLTEACRNKSLIKLFDAGSDDDDSSLTGSSKLI